MGLAVTCKAYKEPYVNGGHMTKEKIDEAL